MRAARRSDPDRKRGRAVAAPEVGSARSRGAQPQRTWPRTEVRGPSVSGTGARSRIPSSAQIPLTNAQYRLERRAAILRETSLELTLFPRGRTTDCHLNPSYRGRRRTRL